MDEKNNVGLSQPEPLLNAYDALIVGASLAGSVMAYILSGRGQKVCLIDPQLFPRRKACGEGLSKLGVKYLKQLGLWNEVRQVVTPFYRYDLILEDGSSVNLGSGAERSPEGYGISRTVLDDRVFKRAMASGNVTKISDSVSKITKEGESWRIFTSGGSSFTSKELILATGAATKKLLPEVKYIEAPTSRFGMAFWCEGEWHRGDAKAVRIFHAAEGQYIITPLSERKVNMSILLTAESAHGLNKEEIKKRGLRKLVEAGFSVSEVTEVLGSAAIHNARVAGVVEGIYLIGDAVERLDPVGGVGMTHALYSASVAANNLLKENLSSRNRVARYYKERNYGALVLRALTAISYSLNTTKNRALVGCVSKMPRLAFVINSLLKATFPIVSGSIMLGNKINPAKDIRCGTVSLNSQKG